MSNFTRQNCRVQFAGLRSNPSLTYFSVFLISLSMISCSEKKNISEEQSSVFTLPHIYQFDNSFKDSVSFFEAENIVDASTYFINKFNFSDTVMIDNEGDRSTSFGRDYIMGDSTSMRILRDSLSSDGLQVFADYKMTIPVNWKSISKGGYYYPVFVVNETNSDKFFTARDHYVSAIQEAKDSNGNWRPIESRKFDFVGNGRWGLIIHPNEFALFLTAKYKGSFKTILRVRMGVGDMTYLTKGFEGTINEKQFHLEPGSYQYEEYKKNLPVSLTRRFLGASPLEPDK